jgi:hypothetical protein
MVFDETGEQMSEYQGRYDDVREKILENASRWAKFYHWFGVSSQPEAVPAERW